MRNEHECKGLSRKVKFSIDRLTYLINQMGTWNSQREVCCLSASPFRSATKILHFPRDLKNYNYKDPSNYEIY